MDCRICSADDLAAVLQGGSRQDGVFLAVNSAAVFYLVCMNAGQAVRVEVARSLEIAVDVEGGGFRARDLSCEVDTEAFFRADKLDAVRVHAADGGEIEGVRRRVFRAFDRRDRSIDIADFVGSSSELGVFRPESGIDFDGAGIDFRRVYTLDIETFACDREIAAFHTDGSEISRCIHLGAPGGKRHFCRIQKAGAVCQNPVGIGDDDAGSVSCDLQKAAQFRRVGARDFVDDDSRRACGEIRIPLHVSRKFGGGKAVAVVEDGTAFRNIEEFIAIDRHAACRGRCDLNEGIAARCFRYKGAFRNWSVVVRKNFLRKSKHRLHRECAQGEPARNLSCQFLLFHAIRASLNDVKHEMNEVMVACFNDSFKRAERGRKRVDVVL